VLIFSACYGLADRRLTMPRQQHRNRKVPSIGLKIGEVLNGS
jgi:hypothetical protein